MFEPPYNCKWDIVIKAEKAVHEENLEFLLIKQRLLNKTALGNWCDVFRCLIQQLQEGVYQLGKGSSQTELSIEKAKAQFER